ncbi:MAG: ribonuclease P protein component [Gammaproteobacteria bacterium]|nr:ribonuclease P protein component [Gammaproteobacteria bacterium]NVK87145.1 ribonuclease P protein component [Gammaproteobacteria bacterium]
MESNDGSFAFPRELRLLSKKQYAQVFKSPSRAGNRAFTVLYCKNDCAYPRLGLAIAKKQVKLASDRNTIKRLIREYFRLNRHDLPNVDMVFLVRRDINSLNNDKIRSALKHVWKQVK